MKNLYAGTLAVLCSASPALAQTGPVDALEHEEGATWLGAITGDGGLAAGVGPDGTVSALLWPDAVGVDQVTFQTAASPDARTLPRFGAAETDGVFVGLWVETAGGSELTWLRDDEWARSLAQDDGAVVLSAVRADLGLTVVETTLARGDVLGRRVLVERAPGSPVVDARLVLWADLDPGGADAGAYWDPRAEQLVWMAPADPAPVTAVLDQAWAPGPWAESGLDRMEEALDEAGAGAFAALAGPAPERVLVGSGDAGQCFDAGSAWDAPVEGDESHAAGCDADAALVWALTFKDDGDAERANLDLALAFGRSRVAAGLAAEPWADGLDDLFHAATEERSERLAALTLPGGATGGAQDFAPLWADTLFATATGSGAWAASVATQPRFTRDRPGPSTWTELALDLAGSWDDVSTHQRHVAAKQLDEASLVDGALVSPPGAWVSERAPFDLVEVGLVVWSVWRHAGFAASDEQARDALSAAWPVVSRGADLLTACVADEHPALALAGDAPEGYPAWWPLYEDVAAGVVPDPSLGPTGAAAGWETIAPCASFEGGSGPARSTLRSVAAARLGLLSAVRAAEALCVDDPRVEAWAQRAADLTAVAVGAWSDDADALGADGALLLWPSPPTTISPRFAALFSTSSDPDQQVLDAEAELDAVLALTADALHERAREAIELERGGDGREATRLLAWARWAAAGDLTPDLDDQLLLGDLVGDLATEAGHLGAAFVPVDTDGDGADDAADQRVGQPHVPTGSRAVVALAAFDAPEALAPAELDGLELACTSGEEPELVREAPGCGDDCENSVSGGRSVTPWWLGLLLAFTALRRRRS